MLALLFITTLVGNTAKAQDILSDPGAYMNAIGNAEIVMNKAYMAYISASAHSSRKRKIEKMRQQAVYSTRIVRIPFMPSLLLREITL